MQANPAHRFALVEHGAGQAYEQPDPSYSGGPQRDAAVLFLCPNEVSAARNRATYPNVPAEVVGSPRVDWLIERSRDAPVDTHGQPTVALSFHWKGPLGVPAEARWALPHYESSLHVVIQALQRRGVEVIGHGHPRMHSHFAGLWRRLGIEHVPRFDDVTARAGVYVCDNSSTLYEFAALGRPVVVLNSPAYRRELNLWPRFWACADVGVQVDRPEDLEVAVQLAIEDPPAVAARRARAVAEVYPLRDGQAAQRSVEAILRVADSVP